MFSIGPFMKTAALFVLALMAFPKIAEQSAIWTDVRDIVLYVIVVFFMLQIYLDRYEKSYSDRVAGLDIVAKKRFRIAWLVRSVLIAFALNMVALALFYESFTPSSFGVWVMIVCLWFVADVTEVIVDIFIEIRRDREAQVEEQKKMEYTQRRKRFTVVK